MPRAFPKKPGNKMKSRLFGKPGNHQAFDRPYGGKYNHLSDECLIHQRSLSLSKSAKAAFPSAKKGAFIKKRR
jgi:hypothetical protein